MPREKFMNYGFVKTAACVPNLKVADCEYNAKEISVLLKNAARLGVSVAVFPELCITGYSCGDLFLQPQLLRAAQNALARLLKETRSLNIVGIVGLPVVADGALLNAAAVFYKGEILGVVPKTYLPNYKEFYEKRWFTSAYEWDGGEVELCGQLVPAGADLLFDAAGMRFGIEICEDLWAPVPPSCALALQGADVIFNLSATNELTGKHTYLRSLLAQQSARCLCGYVYASCGYGESSTDVVFGGNALVYENGTLLSAAQRFSTAAQMAVSEIDVERLRTERRANTTFSGDAAYAQGEPYTLILSGMPAAEKVELTRAVSAFPFVPSGVELAENCEEILSIQTLGLARRLEHTHAKTAVVGISGGLDSTLALLVCVRAFDLLKLPRKGIVGITMPGFGTTGRTYQNALSLMKNLGVTVREISIKDACLQHFKDIGHDVNCHDVTYENAQARERTQVLMDVANQTGGLVIGTGDLSELALGWATYNGDQMSMYGVNAGVPKTLIKYLVSYVAKTCGHAQTEAVLTDIINTPISPELLPADKHGRIAQKTEDLVGPYELHDFFLYYFLRCGFGPEKIYFLSQKAFGKKYKNAELRKWLVNFFRRFFAQQFKRSCMPDGPKVGSVSLSPRGDWRMPSDASAAVWLAEAESLK